MTEKGLRLSSWHSPDSERRRSAARSVEDDLRIWVGIGGIGGAVADTETETETESVSSRETK